MDFFTFKDYQLELNREEILLVKEFSDIMAAKWNSGEAGDKDGRKRLRAFKLLSYVYLMYDWKSPYSEYSDKERHEAALVDSKLEETILKEPESKAVIEKYLALQDSRIVKLLKSAYRLVDELRHHFETVDLQERNAVTGAPVFKSNDLMRDLASLGKTLESIQQLEYLVKKEKEQEKSLRGQASPGMFD